MATDARAADERRARARAAACDVILNCNFPEGSSILRAVRAVRAGDGSPELVAALDELEETLGECAENPEPAAKEKCAAAEARVETAWEADLAAQDAERERARAAACE